MLWLKLLSAIGGKSHSACEQWPAPPLTSGEQCLQLQTRNDEEHHLFEFDHSNLQLFRLSSTRRKHNDREQTGWTFRCWGLGGELRRLPSRVRARLLMTPSSDFEKASFGVATNSTCRGSSKRLPSGSTHGAVCNSISPVHTSGWSLFPNMSGNSNSGSLSLSTNPCTSGSDNMSEPSSES